MTRNAGSQAAHGGASPQLGTSGRLEPAHVARRLGLVSGVRPWGACPLALSLLALLPSVFLLWLLAVLFTEGLVSGREATFLASAQSTCAFGKWTQP